MSNPSAPVGLSTSQAPRAPQPAFALGWRAAGTVVLAAAAGLLVWAETSRGATPPGAIHYGLLSLFLLYMISVWVTGRVGPLQSAMGADGRLSTSKFQFLVWTAVVVFSYAWLYAARAQTGNTDVIGNIPQNVLIAMGISIATAAGAKAITSSYILSGRINKPAPAEGASASDLVANDNDAPDLTKIQMLVWTFVAATVYLVRVAGQVDAFTGCAAASCVFPDIDASLMVLMGLGQGAYLGNKLVTVDTPRITGSSPAGGGWGAPVTLAGESFGATPQWVTINGVQVPVDSAQWKEREIVVAIPRKRPTDGGEWRFHETVQLGVVVNGRQGVGAAAFQIQPPRIDSVVPVKNESVVKVTVTGAAFGVRQDDSRILLNDEVRAVDVESWEDGKIVFSLPAAASGTQLRLRLQIYGQPGPTEKAFAMP